MSIEKLNSKSKTCLPVIPFTQINNIVIQNIKDGDAFLVWAYLQSKSSNWDVIKSHIQNHFGFGVKKIKNIFSYLNKRKLIRYEIYRSEDGKKISHYNIIVLDGSDYVTDQMLTELSTGEVSSGSLINPVGFCSSRKEGTTKERYIPNKDINKRYVFKSKDHEPKCTIREWRPGNPDYDRVNGVRQ